MSHVKIGNISLGVEDYLPSTKSMSRTLALSAPLMLLMIAPKKEVGEKE
jgi:hypothetical protein